MATLTRSMTIAAPVKQVFDFALDVGRFWTCWPGLAVRDVDLKAGGVGTTGTIYSHFLGVHMQGQVEYTEVQPRKRIVATFSALGEHPTWEFTFEPADGGTTLTATAEWHTKVPAVGGAIDTLMVKGHEGELELWLTKIKEQVEMAKAAA